MAATGGLIDLKHQGTKMVLPSSTVAYIWNASRPLGGLPGEGSITSSTTLIYIGSQHPITTTAGSRLYRLVYILYALPYLYI